MVILPLIVVLAVIGVVYAARYRREHAVAIGTDAGTIVSHREPMSSVGRASLLVLLAAVLIWTLTYSSWPIYYVATGAGVAFLLAIYAVAVRHDRSPLLLIPLLVVPLSAALSIAFVLLG